MINSLWAGPGMEPRHSACSAVQQELRGLGAQQKPSGQNSLWRSLLPRIPGYCRYGNALFLYQFYVTSINLKNFYSLLVSVRTARLSNLLYCQKLKSDLFFHSFTHQSLLGSSSMPDTVPGYGDTEKNTKWSLISRCSQYATGDKHVCDEF